MKLNIQRFAGGTFECAKTGTAWNDFQIRIVWTSTNNGSVANTSNVSAKMQARKFSGGTPTSGKNWKGNININGVNNSWNNLPSQLYVSTDWVDVKTVSVNNIQHNDDGTKSITISASLNGCTGTSLEGKTSSGSQVVTLDTIPRANTIIVGNGYIEQTIPINISIKSNSFTTKLYYKLNGQSNYTYITETSNDNYQWLVPASIYQLIPSSPSIGGVIKAETYSNNVYVGQDEKPITLNANQDFCKPVISNTSIVDSINYTALTGSNTRFIRYMSRPRMTFTSTPRNSASIKSNKINGTSVSSPFTATSWADSYRLESIDTRNFPSTYDYPMDIVPYIIPTITASGRRVNPTSSNVLISLSGKYYNGFFDNANQNRNTATFKVRYKKTSSSSWSEIPLTPSIDSGGNFVLSNFTLNNVADYRYGYNVEFIVTDMVVSSSYSMILVKGSPILWWNDNKVEVKKNLIVEGELQLTKLRVTSLHTLSEGDGNLKIDNYSILVGTKVGTYTG